MYRASVWGRQELYHGGNGKAARAGKPLSEVATLRNQYFAEYQQTGAMSKAEIIKFTESFRVHINGSDDPVFIAALALRCLWELTGDSMLEKKMLEVESRYESKS